jgi:hypothetical protein
MDQALPELTSPSIAGESLAEFAKRIKPGEKINVQIDEDVNGEAVN